MYYFKLFVNKIIVITIKQTNTINYETNCFGIKINYYLQAPPFGYKPIGLSGHWRER